MLRVGDKVYKWNEMHKVGTVERLVEKTINTWLIGGAASKGLFASVRYADDSVADIPMSELKLSERP